ncbi:hypothetical protein ACHWQZ_G019215 [Mnemiopsis leidyi]
MVWVVVLLITITGTCASDVEEELLAWELAMNINPSDGHIFGYTVGWHTGDQIGGPNEALIQDFLDSRVWSSPANYIAIVRHQGGVIDAFKVFKFKDGGPSLLNRFGLSNMDPGRQVVTEGGPIQQSIAADALNIDTDPIFAVGGDLAFNWIYSNNGNRITLTGGHLSEANSNDDNTRGIGNTFRGNVKEGTKIDNYWISDVTRAAGTSYIVQGTDHGSQLQGVPAYGSYAIFVSPRKGQFPQTGTKLSLRLPILECTGFRTEWINIVADQEFPVCEGTVFSLSCNEGHVHKGDKLITCHKNTEFQFSEEPYCECPGLEISNAMVSLSGDVPQGTAVTVTCLKPKRHVLFGNKEVTCQSEGWSDKPECRKCGFKDRNIPYKDIRDYAEQ